MQVISDLKEQPVIDAPLIVFDCVLSTGLVEHWCTHGIQAGGNTYAARVLQHSSFDFQIASDQGIDGSPQIAIVLANADSHFSEIERAIGWKGARLTVGVLFYDLRNNVPLTEIAVVFQGTCNPPDRSDEATFRLSAINRMGLQRVFLPQIRIERRCPWRFPATVAQQMEAVDGGVRGKYSLYYRCGYSAGLPGGTGNLQGTTPFTSCGYTRSDCQERGMITRFGGVEFVPPAISVRSYGKDWSPSAISVNQARYNDYVPMVYGTVWHAPTVVFARNDGNLTRMEVLLGVGEIQGVLTVLVNDVEIPLGVSGKNMTGTGWYNIESLGTRDGAFDPNFRDASGAPAGDPFGSMAYLSVAVPNQVNSGTSLPVVKVLLQGLRLPVYELDGTPICDRFSNNPAWILLDVLRRSGWAASEIDIPSFADAARYCDQAIAVLDPNGNTINLARFSCNLLLQKRRSAGDVVRAVRNCARMFLTYGAGGLLRAKVENTLALEHATQQPWSNSSERLNGGWPSYEFGDGSNGFSGILRKASGAASVAMTSRSIADTPNNISVEFQDALNSYQQDSFEMVDPDDVALTGQMTTSTLMALGLPHYDQAARILKFNLDKSLRGNTYIEFQTSIRAFGIAPGDIVTITYLKEGFVRQPFRVLKLSPATNFRLSTITAQIHDDAWYADTNGQAISPTGAVLQDMTGVGLPRPLLGSRVSESGEVEFGVSETLIANGDGSIGANVAVSFVPPVPVSMGGPRAPLIGLTANVGAGGTLSGGQILYYAVAAADILGQESKLSFVVRANVAGDDSSVTISGLSFAAGTTGFHVYRGSSPAQLLRVVSNASLVDSFTDAGLTYQLTPPADPNFDHANFYWRSEVQPEIAASIYSPTSIGNLTLQMSANIYRGLALRISRGTGFGQERTIVANDATSLTVSRWTVEPDAASFFTVSEAGWHLGAVTRSSPVQFAIPNRTGEVVQITGRAANINGIECSTGIATVTRWQTGGSGAADVDVPPTPFFGLGPGIGGGTAVLSGVSFDDLRNTNTISSGTLTLYYWNEFQGIPLTVLSREMASADVTLTLSVAGTGTAGCLLQIDGEILKITGVANNGGLYDVVRGVHGSTAVLHDAGSPVYILSARSVTMPFPRGFFGSPYSGSWTYPIAMPDVRIGSTELFVTNQKGNSPVNVVCMTHNDDRGLRTLSGGQYSIQVDGFLAVEASVAPVVIVETARSVRDVFAILGRAADAEVQIQIDLNGTLFCALMFQPGAITSNSVSGSSLAVLPAMGRLTLGVLSVGQTYPGSDLTVIIRL